MKTCEYCKYRGPTTYENTSDGVKHRCWCMLDGIPGPLHNLFEKACERYGLADKWKKDV